MFLVGHQHSFIVMPASFTCTIMVLYVVHFQADDIVMNHLYTVLPRSGTFKTSSQTMNAIQVSSDISFYSIVHEVYHRTIVLGILWW